MIMCSDRCLIIAATACLLSLAGLQGCKCQDSTGAEFEKALLESGFIHEPLAIADDLSFEKLTVAIKEVTDSLPLPGRWTLTLPNDTGVRAKGSPDDPDYATYGNFSIDIPLAADISGKYNRISFMVYPDCEGMGVVNINLGVGGISHLINLRNRQWNRCFLEVDPAILGSVRHISISSTARGRDLTYGQDAIYHIDSLRLEKVARPYKESGWVPDTGIISYSTSGYSIGYEKTAIAAAGYSDSRIFRIVDERGRTTYRGRPEEVESSIGKYTVLDFTALDKAGEYAIEFAGMRTPYFRIGTDVWKNSQWKVLNFIFCQRCGHNVAGIHSTCHTDLYSEHDGVRIPYCGGWHDAGDLSQQTLQTADVTFALFETYNRLKDSDPLMAARMKEEGRWGLEFILKNRFGDGYRASSMGLLHWLDGIVGSKDDITTVRVQNLPFDNFLYSGYEAYSALTLKDSDPKMYDYLVKVAQEDYAFAMEKYRKDGYAGFIQPYEHTYNTSESQFMATVSWAASQLYLLTGKQEYALQAAEYIRYVIDCQQTEPLGNGQIKGFFYRDLSKKSIVHYIHQSREQFYMMALEVLCRTQPGHPDRRRWEYSMESYAGYLKAINGYTSPYNMIPSGVYHIDEPADTEAFYALHLFPPADAHERYEAQVIKGVNIADGFYLKRFPVWFNIFNGNNAVILATAKAAAICGNHLNDPVLKQIALDQMYWIAGRNPFNQSMIYGEGANYPALDSFSSGDIVGAIPVGIKTVGDEDVPCWPQVTNACYKEVWVTSAGKWLSLLSEF